MKADWFNLSTFDVAGATRNQSAFISVHGAVQDGSLRLFILPSLPGSRTKPGQLPDEPVKFRRNTITVSEHRPESAFLSDSRRDGTDMKAGWSIFMDMAGAKLSVSACFHVGEAPRCGRRIHKIHPLRGLGL